MPLKLIVTDPKLCSGGPLPEGDVKRVVELNIDNIDSCNNANMCLYVADILKSFSEVQHLKICSNDVSSWM